MAGGSPRGIFLSYRREDAAAYARLLKSALNERFPDVPVFMDLDFIEAGVDLGEVIREAVESCAVLVALIGRQWVSLCDEHGRRRLDDPDDYVRFEIRAALERGARVIPVLVDGARPPRPEHLPADLGKLARLTALDLSHSRYHYDLDRLCDLVQPVLAVAAVAAVTGGPEQGAGRRTPQASGPRRQRAAIMVFAVAVAAIGLAAAVLDAFGAPAAPRSPGGSVRWIYTTGNSIGSSPVVVGGTIYIGSDDHKVHALSTATGRPRWTFTTGNIIDSSLTVSGGTGYVGSWDHKVYALNIATGRPRWIFTTGGKVDSNPAVSGGTVYLGSWDHKVYALSTATGRPRWTFTTKGNVNSSPTVAAGTVYIGSDDHKVYALNAATGRLRWTYVTGGKVYSSPAVAAGTVYIGSDDHKVYALNAATGRPRWSYRTGDHVAAKPAVSDGTVYVGSWDDKVYALDIATGRPRWTFTTGSAIGSNAAVSDGTVYIGSWDHNVYALRAGS